MPPPSIDAVDRSRTKRWGGAATGPGGTLTGPGRGGAGVDDGEAMARAVALAKEARPRVTPRAWVGAVLVTVDGTAFEGATHPIPGPHAELAALAAAGEAASGGTLYTTLEP